VAYTTLLFTGETVGVCEVDRSIFYFTEGVYYGVICFFF